MPTNHLEPGSLWSHVVHVPHGSRVLVGNLTVPSHAHGVVLLAHSSSSRRLSVRHRAVASDLNDARLATLLLDLLTPDEDRSDESSVRPRIDIEQLAARLVTATSWLARDGRTRRLPIGYLGASTAAGAALVAAARSTGQVGAVVSRSGRPDLAGEALARVTVPTLLIVGEHDAAGLEIHRQAMSRMTCPTRLSVVPGATHLFEEPGALLGAARLARRWFLQTLTL